MVTAAKGAVNYYNYTQEEAAQAEAEAIL